MITADKWAQARALGFEDDELLDVVEEDYPDYAPKIKQARELGFSSQDIVNELDDIIVRQPAEASKEKKTAASTLVESTQQFPLRKEFTEESLYKPRELTPEQLKKMSIAEKMEYADELNRYMQLKRSKGFTKAALSGLSFGLSENIPGLHTKREGPSYEDLLEGKFDPEDVGGFAGFLAGSALPVHVGYKIFGAPLVKLASQSPKYAAGLQALARMTGMGITGGLYSEAHESGRDLKMPTAEGFMRHAESWAKFDAVLQALGLGGRMASRLLKWYQKAPVPKSVKPNEIKRLEAPIERKRITYEPGEVKEEPQKILEGPQERKRITYEPEPEPVQETKRLNAPKERKLLEKLPEKVEPKIEPPSVDEKINEVIKKVDLNESNPEVLREQVSKAIDEVFPERLEMTAKEAAQASKQTQEMISQIPGVRGQLASEAFNRRMIRTPEQLENFIEEYDAIYPGIQGTAKDKARKFLNKYAERNVKPIKISPESNSEIKGIEVTPQTKLDRAEINYRNAKASGNKKAIKQAKRELELARRRVENAQEPPPKPEKEAARPLIKRPEVESSSAKSIENNIEKIRNQIDKTEQKPPSPERDVKLNILRKNLENQQKALAKAKKILSSKEAKKGQLVDYEGPAQDRAETAKSEFRELVPRKPESVEEPTPLYGKKSGKLIGYKGPITRENQFQAEDIAATSAEDLVITPKGDSEGVKIPINDSKGNVKNVDVELVPAEQELADQFAEAVDKGDSKQASQIADQLRDQVFKRITISLKPQPLKISRPAEKSAPKKSQPITEEGMSVEESIEYPKTNYDKAYEAVGNAYEKAKTPIETSKEIVRNVNTAIFNALEPLERLEVNIEPALRPSTALKQAKTAASEVNAVMEYGRFNNATNTFDTVSLKEGYAGVPLFKFKKDTLPGEFSIEELNEYRKAKITLKRQREGKKVGVDTADAKETVSRLARYAPMDKKIRQFQQETLRAYGKDTLGQELIDLWNSDYYAPLYRVMDHGSDAIFKAGSLQPKQWIKRMKGSERKSLPPSESDVYNLSMLVTNARKNESVLNYKKGVESGQLPGNIRKGTNNNLSDAQLKDLDIDPRLKKATENLYSQTRKDGFTPSKNVLRGWKDGKPFEIEVPQEVFQAYQTLAPLPNNFFSHALLSTKNFFSKSIARSTKFPSILARDFANAWLTSTANNNPKNIAQGVWSAMSRDQDYKRFLSLGGDAYASRLVSRIERANSLDELVTPGRRGPIAPFSEIYKKGSDFIRKVDDLSMAVPLTEFKAALKKYGDTPNGRIMAMLDARSVTYDPTRKGVYTQSVGAYFPFFNVSMQETGQVLQNMAKNPVYWAKGLTAISLPTLILKMHNDDNPDYQSLTAVDKLAFWHFYLPDGSHYRMPIPWQHGVLFKSGAEAAFDLAKGIGGDAWKAMFNLFMDNVSGDVPPLMQAFSQATVEKTLPSPFAFATGQEGKHPDVIPKRLENFPKDKQYTSRTSYLAKKMGELWGVSPIKIETVAKSFGGVALQDALSITDEVVYWSGLAEDKRPEKHYLSILGFEASSTPSRTKAQNEFYEIMEKQRQQKAIKEKPEGLDLSRYNSQISKLFKRYREVEDSTISAAEKRKQLTDIQKQINVLYTKGVSDYRASIK